MSAQLSPAQLALVDLALEEDLGRGDVTAQAVLGAAQATAVARAHVIAKQPLVIAGLAVAHAVCARVDPRIEFSPRAADGDAFAGQREVVAELVGPAPSVLAAERTMLNFLQRLSGVATLSRRYADAVAGTRTRVVDTRKTTPGFRALEKAAVRAGGCHNHRADLGSGVLIKDNHLVAAGGVTAAIARARAQAPHSLRLEVEVTTAAQLAEALAARADVVMLDNWPLATLADAVAQAHAAGALVEVSGGVTLATLGAIAATGCDLVSVGALTHSAPAVDLSLEFL